MDEDGNIDIITNKEDLIVDNSGRLIEHWLLEKALCSHNVIKGAQVIDRVFFFFSFFFCDFYF